MLLHALRTYDLAETVLRAIVTARDAAVASLRTTAMHERLHGLRTWRDARDVSMLAHTARAASVIDALADRLS